MSKQAGFINIFVILLILVGLGLGIFLIQNPTILRSRASQASRVEFLNQAGELINSTTELKVKLRATYVPPQSVATTPEPTSTASPDPTPIPTPTPKPLPEPFSREWSIDWEKI